MALDLTRLRINQDRLRNHFEALARIGATPEGGPGPQRGSPFDGSGEGREGEPR